MPVFPSVEWFNEVGRVANESGVFRPLGTCDAEIGVKVGDRYFELDFEAFEFVGAKEVDARRADDLDFVLVMDYDGWKEMLQNIKQHGRADLDHTLNSIDLRSPEEFARSRDYYRRDKFYRFNQTFQEYFDASAKVDTEFAETVSA